MANKPNKNKEKFDSRIELRCFETFKDQVFNAAEKENKDVSDFIRDLINMKMEADKIKHTLKLKQNQKTFKCKHCGVKYIIDTTGK